MARVKLAALALALAALPACASAQSDPGSAPHWDLVAFEVNSWGTPVSSWRMLSNGSGSWTEAVRPEGEPPTAAPTLVWHDIAPDTANYQTLQKILDDLPEVAPNFEECANFLTDAPYGTLRLTRGATTIEISWNDGCLDDDYRSFIAILREADEHVSALGKLAPVLRTEAPPED